MEPRRKRRNLRNTKARFLEELEESDTAEALFTDSDDLESLNQYQESLYPESEYSESYQTVADCSTLFESSGENSDTTADYSVTASEKSNMTTSSSSEKKRPTIHQEITSGEFEYVVCDLEGITDFTIENRTFKKTIDDWRCPALDYTAEKKTDDNGECLVIPVKIIFKGKGKDKEEFNDEDEFDEAEMKELLTKKTIELSNEEQEKVNSYQKHQMLETQKKLLELTQAHDRRERELAKQKNKGIFDTVAEYLERNQKNVPDEYTLEINLDSDDEEEPPVPDEEDEDDLEEQKKKDMQVLVKAFKAAGLGAKETKWSEFPKFGGGEDDPYEWLDQYEAACEVNGVKGNRILELLSASLEGPALYWWRTARKNVTIWEAWKSEYHRKRSFKYQFLTRFCGPERQQRWMEELRNCRQRAGETVSEYYGKLQTLYRKADPAGQYPERDHYQQFLKGLRSELRTAVRLAAASNLREAVERAKAAEAAYSMDGSLAGYSMVKKHDEELHKELKELKELLTRSAQESCDLCYKKGHQAVDCPQRSLKTTNQQKKTCKICGKTGHWARECMKNRTCFTCGQVGHLANRCPHSGQPRQILQRNNQQQLVPKKVFIAQQNQLDPEDQEQNYVYYQPNFYHQQPQYYNTPPPAVKQPLQIEQSNTTNSTDTLGMLAAAVTELNNKVNNLKG